jgi:hypothetical protein
MRTISGFFSDLLELHGAVVEKTEDGSLEVLSPPDVSEQLGMPEEARLIFSYEADSGNGIYASYDSEVFKAALKLFQGKGRFSHAVFPAQEMQISKLADVVHDRYSLANAIFRPGKCETAKITYLLVYFRYSALSDEKHEGITSVLVNLKNLSVSAHGKGLDVVLERLVPPEEGAAADMSGAPAGLAAAHAAASSAVAADLSDAVKSLERRLNRDAARVYEYYGALRDETKKAIVRKGEFSRDAGKEEVERLLSERKIKGEGIDRLYEKLDAIEAERKWKVQDLVSKYSMTLRLEPISIIAIVADAPVFWLTIKRRLASREFPATYNPILRHFDPFPCEGCFSPGRSHYICDDRLHIVCSRCHSPCSACGKEFCRACHKICPRCKGKK